MNIQSRSARVRRPRSPRPSRQDEQQLLTDFRRMDGLEQNVFMACTDLLARDGIAGWVRVRDALDVAIQAARRRAKKKAS